MIVNPKLVEIGLKKLDEELGMSWSEIGAMFNLTDEQARQAVKYFRKKNGLLKGKYENGRERILILNDLHVPDHKEDMILDIITQHANINVIILVGDILDCKAVSAWYDEEISILDYEMIQAHALLKKIRTITKAKIILVKGNHEQRVNTHYARNAKAMGTAVVETEILYKLANGFEVKHKSKVKTKNKEEVEKRTKYEAVEDVYYCGARSYLHGDLLVNHPSIFSKDHMKTVYRIWNEKLRTKYPQAKVVLIGHTHQLGQIYSEDGKILIENGCMCFPARYADNDDRPYKIQQYGYTYLEMKDGVTDTDTIKVQYLGHDLLEEADEEID